MLSVTLYGRFGNQLWQYAVCRTVAEKLNYKFHIPRYFQNYLGCDLGEPNEEINSFFPSQNNHCHIQKYDERIFSIPDGTKIDGYHQSEKYILENRNNILNWFSVPNPEDLLRMINLNDDTCVINFRGGDYAPMNEVFLPQKFWDESISKMKEINPNMTFKVVTDDPNLASQFFPDFEIYHFGIIQDFSIVKYAKYLIIANSTFSWWAAWLNEKVEITIAPKYWMRHNISKGWWSPSDSLTTRFHYLDRDGKFQTYEECLEEINPEYNYLDHYHFNFD